MINGDGCLIQVDDNTGWTELPGKFCCFLFQCQRFLCYLHTHLKEPFSDNYFHENYGHPSLDTDRIKLSDIRSQNSVSPSCLILADVW